MFTVTRTATSCTGTVTRYVDWLKRLPEFETFLAPGFRGNTSAPIFSELVSISGKGRIPEHLVQLLGENQKAVVSIVRAPSGVKILMLDQIP